MEQFIPNYENKIQYILSLVKDVNNIQILELGVREGISTNYFLKICKKKTEN